MSIKHHMLSNTWVLDTIQTNLMCEELNFIFISFSPVYLKAMPSENSQLRLFPSRLLKKKKKEENGEHFKTSYREVPGYDSKSLGSYRIITSQPFIILPFKIQGKNRKKLEKSCLFWNLDCQTILRSSGHGTQ